VHDPELVPSLMAVQHPCKIWDVHEDTSAALSMKSWLPTPLRKLTARGVQSLEGKAEGQLHLLLAEQGYVDRFSMRHPVVPNSTPVPESVSDPDQPRAVYVGHISQARGGKDLIAVGSLLRRRGSSMKLEVIGHADPQMATELASAHSNGDIVWHGFLPNASALKIVEGSMAGLSLLHDEPNYRHSKPTKVIEYMARGVPVITTPTPPAQELIERYSCGLVVPFNDPAAVVAALTQLEAEPELRREFARGGRSGALTDHDWNRDAGMFVEQIHQWIEK
jgi:glycosyltransferase involved in cell wall biosynthesis